MDCSTAEGGISPLVNGVVSVESSEEEAAMDSADLLFLFPPATWLVYEFVYLLFFVESLESLIVSSTLAFVCQERAHAQALNRYIALASVPTCINLV